jgi:AmiR/NasT family two-component response regulator
LVTLAAKLSKNSRTIGIAMGVLMIQRKITEDQAFDALRIISQHTRRKIADLAAYVAHTGDLPPLPDRGSAGRDPSKPYPDSRRPRHP